MLCLYDDLGHIICTVLRGRYCVIQHSCCNTNKTIIIIIIIIIFTAGNKVRQMTEGLDGDRNTDRPTSIGLCGIFRCQIFRFGTLRVHYESAQKPSLFGVP